MKRKYIIINSFLILIGIIGMLGGKLIDGDVFLGELGVAFVTGGITALITTMLIAEKNDTSCAEKWGLNAIYSKRSDMNIQCDACLEKCTKQLDFIALGLKGFRDAATDLVIKKVNSGVNLRIITVAPTSPFLKQKAVEEGSVTESMSSNIESMISWAQEINARTREGAVQVKTYDGLPMFSYQRVDDYVFVGPNLRGMSSQKCISYEYHRGEGKEYFVNYFEKLWNDKAMTKVV